MYPEKGCIHLETQIYYERSEPFSIQFKDSGKRNSWAPLEHYHDSYEIVLFINADFEIFVKDTKYQIQNGSLLLIEPYEIHRFFYNANHVYTRCVLNFKADYLKDLLNTLGLETLLHDIHLKKIKKFNLDIKQRVKIEDMLRTLLDLNNKMELVQDDITLEPALKMHLALLLIEFKKMAAFWLTQRKPYVQSHSLVQDVILYIDEHYSEAFKLSDLETVFKKSKYLICRNFSESTRFTIVEYVQYRRIIEAQKMLTQGEKPIVEIGFDCGFQNVQHFYRTFKKISGKSPAQFRAGL